MAQKNEPNKGLWEFYAHMYNHYNELLIIIRPSHLKDAQAFREKERDMYAEKFLDMVPIENIAGAAGLTKIETGYAIT